MKIKLANKEKGFTIIEVLIVLAIAGLILLIVFLAVPALQRNSRNTQYKNQVSGYLGAVNEWMNNNNGSVPTTTPNNSLTAAGSGINALAANGPLTEPTTIQTGAQTTPVPIGQMQLVTSATCSTTTQGDTTAGSARSIAIRYSTEDSGGNAVEQCTGS